MDGDLVSIFKLFLGYTKPSVIHPPYIQKKQKKSLLNSSILGGGSFDFRVTPNPNDLWTFIWTRSLTIFDDDPILLKYILIVMKILTTLLTSTI